MTNPPRFEKGENILSPRFRKKLNQWSQFVHDSAAGNGPLPQMAGARLFQVKAGQSWATSTTGGVTDDVTSAICRSVQLTAPGASTDPNEYAELGAEERVYNPLNAHPPDAAGDFFWAVFNTQSGRWEMLGLGSVTHMKHAASDGAISWQENFPVDLSSHAGVYLIDFDTDLYLARPWDGDASVEGDDLIKRISSAGAEEQVYTPDINDTDHQQIGDIAVDGSGELNIGVGLNDIFGTAKTLFQHDSSDSENWSIAIGPVYEVETDKSSDDVYVSRYNSSASSLQLSKYNSSGTHQWSITAPSATGTFPAAFLYFANSKLYVIHKPVASQIILTEVSTGGTPTAHATLTLSETPAGLAVTSSDYIFTTATGNMYSYDLAADTQNWANTSSPKRWFGSLDVDGSGNIYAEDSEFGSSYIAKLNSSGTEQWQVLSAVNNAASARLGIHARSGDVYAAGGIRKRIK